MSQVDVELETQVNEIYGKTTVSQKFSNSEDKPIELKIYLDKVPDLVFNSFQIKIGDSIKAKSKIIKKEKATVKYTDAISSGNAAIFVAETNENIIINMGNIPPKEEVIFISDFIYFIKYTEYYEFEIFRNLPIFIGKGDERYENNKLKEKIYIKTKNKICAIHKDINDADNELKIIEEKYLNDEKNEYFIHYEIEDLYIYYSEDVTISKIYFDTIYTEPKVFLQKSKQFKEDNYIIQFKCKAKKLEEESSYPALFIFLIDQNGSKWGNRIKIAQNFLELFLKSLPVKSYYQLIGLSSSFVKYDEIPKEYTQENFQKSIKTIETLNSDYNTFPYEIYDDIFFLPDEYIKDKEKILNLKDNNQKFRIFSICIGKHFNPLAMQKLGLFYEAGYFCCNNDINILNSNVVKELKKRKRKSISKLKLDCSLDNENCIQQIEKPYLILINDIINFHYLIPRKTLDKIKFEIMINLSQSKEEIKEKFEIKPIEFPEGEEFSKLLIKNDLKNYSKEIKKNKALKYQILDESTTLFAEIELSNQITEEMKLKILGEEKNNVMEIYKPKKINKIKNIDNNTSSQNWTNYGNMGYYNIMSPMGMNNSMMSMNPMGMSNSMMNMNPMGMSNSMMNMNPMSMGIPMMNMNPMGMNNPMMNMNPMGMGIPMMNMNSMSISNPMMNMNLMNMRNPMMDMNNLNMMNQIMSNNMDKIHNKTNSYTKEQKGQDQEREYEEKNLIETRELKKQMEEKEQIMKMIKTQDNIEGFWDVNDSTEFIFEKYKKQYDSLKQKNLSDKVVMTILVIYYLKNQNLYFSNELLMIIIKAESYIKKEINCSYEEIIEKIK